MTFPKFLATLSLAAILCPTMFAQSTAKVATGAPVPSGAAQKAAPSKTPCWIFPLAQYTCMGINKTGKSPIYLREESNKAVNKFWGTTKDLTYFNQIKTNFNGASGSANISADLATLNFNNGMQVVVGTNVQAAPATTGSTATALVPTLSATSAGQAAQNVLRGGNVYFAALYPILDLHNAPNEAGGFSLRADLVARQGFDIQTFKPSTNISITQPPSHTNLQMEGYLVYNSSNPPEGETEGFAGSLLIGGSYGYAYASHAYARDYGFGPRLSRPVGEFSVGMLINKLGKITISRAFGPSQTYIDATTQKQTTVDYFKTWTFGITYQSKAKTE